jgi:hypothetical protein
VHGHIIKPTKTELNAIRRAGRATYQHLYRTVEQTLNQASPQHEDTPLEAAQEIPAPHPPPRRRALEEDSRAAPTGTSSASQASLPTTGREKRPRRAAAGRTNLNVRDMSANSLLPRATIYTDPSTSEREDISMSDESPSTC